MNKEKQIEGMASAIREITVKCGKCEHYIYGSCIKPVDMGCDINEDILNECDAIYENDYRKASEVAEEIIADLENRIDGLLKVLIEERTSEWVVDTPLEEYLSGEIDAYSSIKFRLAELKKKYTEGEKD